MIAPAQAADAFPSTSVHGERGVLREMVTTTGANVRSSPSTTGAVVRVLGAGTPVSVVESDGAWHRVLGVGGEPLGWVHGSILR